MIGPQTLTGAFTDGRTIVLEQAITPVPGRVRMIVEPISEANTSVSLWDFLDELGRKQTARGHVPRTRDEIDRALHEERCNWDD
jgi:hypothetical protein